MHDYRIRSVGPGVLRGVRKVPFAVMTAGLLAGCGAVPPAAQQRLAQARENYDRAAYAAAEQLATGFLNEYAWSSTAADAYYLRGLCRIELGQRERAKADFTAGVAAAGKRQDAGALCRAMLGNLAAEDGYANLAIEYYTNAVPLLPARPPTDEALYRYGVCLQRVGRWSEARRVFSRLLHEFATSRHAPAARRRFSWRHGFFTIQCGAFDRVDEANKAAQELGTRGLAGSVEYGDLDGHPAWRVLTGRYATYDQATADLERVREAAPDAVVVP